MYTKVKRLMDLLVALFVIATLSPIIIIIGTLLAMQLKKSPFFVQSRPGRKGEIFKIIKFQTMLDIRDARGKLLDDHLRITPFGNFLRKASLDELPQLFNIISGNMSFVGPRPLLVEYLELYNDYQRKRHDVRPGITGWAQVNGRNAISWEEKFKFDVDYVHKCSFLLDLKILMKTVVKAITRNGSQSSEQVTREKLRG